MPCAPSCRAISLPMPLFAPVMRAIFRSILCPYFSSPFHCSRFRGICASSASYGTMLRRCYNGDPRLETHSSCPRWSCRPSRWLAVGCASHSPARRNGSGRPGVRAPPGRAAPRPDPAAAARQLAALHADEAGRIPILMYHAIGGPPFRGTLYDKEGLNIAPATFRKHLDLMYAAHWYPVNMRDVLTSHISVPAGKTPVVLTFDDARGTQFHYLKDGTIDPNCAVGILHAFHKKHPDWPLRATFYVLPQSAWNPVPFWQRGIRKPRSCAPWWPTASRSPTTRSRTAR